MLVRELADIIHENAVAHGWWDEERAATEIVALIHSEWSEALEEGRKGAPMAYIEVVQDWQGYRVDVRIERGEDGRYVGEDGTVYTGRYKPEGIAVELIDGCIRILDWRGCAGCDKIEDATGHDMDAGRPFDPDMRTAYGDSKEPGER